jgi:hypothetical protein
MSLRLLRDIAKLSLRMEELVALEPVGWVLKPCRSKMSAFRMVKTLMQAHSLLKSKIISCDVPRFSAFFYQLAYLSSRTKSRA